MKKTIVILSVMILLFTVACNKQIVEEPSTTSGFDTYIDSTKAAETDLTQKNKTEITEYAENGTSKVEEHSEKKISTVQDVSQKDAEEVPPYMLTVDLNDLKQIKTATKTMDEAEFAEYMSKNFAAEVVNGMNTLDKTKIILDELEGTYLPLLDGDESNFSTVSFYLGNNEVHQLTYFDKSRRIVAYSQTPKYDTQKRRLFGEYNENAVLVRTVENDLYNAKVYTTENTEHFYVDLIIGDSYIYLRTHDIQTIDEFEADFARLEFVKIGDLLNE